MIRRVLAVAGLAAVGGVVWLARQPTRVTAVRWDGLPLVPSRTAGPYADTAGAFPVTRFAQPPGLKAPESTAVDAAGRVYTGFRGGAIVRFGADGQTWEPFADTGGRPLGLRFHPDGDLLIADAERGLLRCTPAGEVTVLTTGADGTPFAFTDDLDVDAAGRFVYFTDASAKFGFHETLLDLLEHGGHGRVLRHDLHSGETTVLRAGLNFPNGVTLSPDGSALLVTETATASVHRLWLTGDRAGTWAVFADNLPGYPDNIRSDGERYWVALPSRRTPLLDATPRHPRLREFLARVMTRVRLPLPEEAMLVALDDRGRPVAYATDATPTAYGYITQVLRHGDDLILSSLHQSTLARVPVQRFLAPRTVP